MNYTTLFNQIIAYANRGGSIEFAAAIPYFIENAQQKIWKELEHGAEEAAKAGDPEAIKKLYQGQIRNKSKALSKK